MSFSTWCEVSDREVERARLAAVESRRTMEEKYFTIKQIAGGQEEAAAEAAVTLEEYRRLLALVSPTGKSDCLLRA